MAKIVEDINKTGGFNPYELSWGKEITFPSTRTIKEYGNRIYNRYPARSVFLVPRAILYHQQNNGLRVLDPFMGLATTGIACVNQKRNFIGIELNPEYFEMAKQRLNDETAQISLFDFFGLDHVCNQKS